jgi:D-lactate dehydrogenase
VDAVVFSTRPTERGILEDLNRAAGHRLVFVEPSLTEATAALAAGTPCVCAFANDTLSAPVLRRLRDGGTRLLALRSAGFNHVDLEAAAELGFTVLRVPAYSPHAVAEHTAALILTLNRKTHRAFNRVREQNFSLDGLLGFDLYRKTVGVVGTGKIGGVFAGIMQGFGCTVLACDPVTNPELVARGVAYLPLKEMLARCDIVSLHCPLNPATRHLIDGAALEAIKPGAMLVNTSRGAVIDSKAAIEALKSGRLGALALDVYEEEGDLFFRDLSERVIQDDVFVRLMTFPNVLITAHQAFFTREAVTEIARTTLANMTDFERGTVRAENVVSAATHAARPR